MNGHPRARMKLILRLCENPVKIYNSRPLPALNYSLKWSNIAGQGSNIKNVQIIFLGNFISIEGVQGAIQEGPEPIPELKIIKNKENMVAVIVPQWFIFLFLDHFFDLPIIQTFWMIWPLEGTIIQTLFPTLPISGERRPC